MFIEIIKFFIYSTLIVLISKYILVKTLRNLGENLNLKPQTIGEIAGYATSMPEFLTITISSFSGLMGASISNVLSSNIINLIQYVAAITMNKNGKYLNNKAIKTDVVLVALTIIIPIGLIMMKIESNMKIVPMFILLFGLFKVINTNVHKLYLRKEDHILEKEIEKEAKGERHNISKTIRHILILIVTGISLYIIGDKLGVVLENLCNIFGIQEFIVGILLGFITSIPELMTFFESQKYYKSRKNQMPGVVEATNNLLISNILNLFIIQTVGITIFNL